MSNATEDAALPTWDERARPRGARPADLSAADRARGRHLAQVHDHYRSQLRQVGLVLERVAAGAAGVSAARSAVHAMGLRATYEQLGSFCGQACSLVEVHHTIEDRQLYPALRRADAGLGGVLDRLVEEHTVVHAVLVALDAELVGLADDPDRLARVRVLFAHLETLLLSHFAYEEDELCDLLGYHRVF